MAVVSSAGYQVDQLGDALVSPPSWSPLIRAKRTNSLISARRELGGAG
ncbi:MAG: hypothetical protein R3A46_07920 [Thermomicrobiales bacterium]